MRTNQFNYLSKSNENSPLFFKKSPVKYMYSELKVQDAYDTSRLTDSSSGRKQTNTDQYRNIKKVPDNLSSLRQTFDLGAHSRLQEKFSKYDLDAQDSYQPKYQSPLSQTFNGKASPATRDLTSSTVNQRVSRASDYSIYLSNSSNVRSPISDKPKRDYDIEQKFKKYVNTIEQVKDFKNQLEATSKMNEQLKRLKEERKKKLQEKERQLNQLQKKLNKEQITETFKKKDSYYNYTPKESKSSYNDRFQKKQASNLDLSKYKTKDLPVTTSVPMSKASSRGNQDKLDCYSPVSRKSQQHFSSSIRLSDFILGKNLGEGKFGLVYQALHKSTGWLFAIKKVPKDTIKSHLMVDQFILELKLQTYLSHEYILTLFCAFDDRTSIYLVLEYMEQGTLFAHLKKNKTLPEKQVAVKIQQITLAVKYLHENAIAHRDIKPQNIVMSHGVCKLCDFGWSTVCDDRRKTYCGTFDYAPPQILEGVQYDYSVDLWCLGVLTYELLVGKAPFYHISRKETMKKILNVEKTNIQYPESLSRITISFIDRLIKKDPNQRMSCEMMLEHPFFAKQNNS